MSMHLPTIWVFTWYDSMSRDYHMTIFSSKSSLFCRSWHISNPAETRVKDLFRLFIIWRCKEVVYFRITLKKTFGSVELQKIDNVSAGLSSVTVYMETRLNKSTLKTGLIFEKVVWKRCKKVISQEYNFNEYFSYINSDFMNTSRLQSYFKV